MAAKPLVFVADDDPVFLRLAEQLLSKFGAAPEVFSDRAGIEKRLREKVPAFCIIDLNLVEEKAGFELITWVRWEVSKTVPLIVVSGDTDVSSVAHAIELGANDYLLKPLNREVFVAKLMAYLKSEELEKESSGFRAVPGTETVADLTLEMQLQEVDELGLRVLSKHLIAKGTVVSVGGPMIASITGSDAPLQVTAATTWVESETGAYGAYLEFDALDAKIGGKVRDWIVGAGSGSKKAE